MTAVLLDGIVLGLQFGLLGVGLTIIYGMGGVLNLAYGPMAVASTIMRPVYRRSGDHRVLLSLLLTIGVAFIINGILVWRLPLESLGLNVGGDPLSILGVPMRTGSILASAITIVVGGALIFFFRATTTGKAVRSVIQDEVGARLCGVNPASVRALIFTMSGALAGLVAITISMTSPVPVTDGFRLTILALLVTVVGGLGSIRGALLAGLILGMVNAMSSFYIGSYITTIILLAAAALTILVRPSGLFGKRT
jgi:branched-chain amino acid transport system permease protein